MFCGIITPLIKNGRTARRLHGTMVAIVGILSVILLVNVVQEREAFTFMMGHFPAPWGNELRIGPLEALLAVLISAVMFLTITAGSKQLFQEIVPEKQNFYFIMLNATFGAMLAMTYTNDLFTAYVFIEILTIASCTLILAKGTKQSIVGTTHYLVFGCVGSGLFLLGVCILYGITGHLLFPQIRETVALMMVTGDHNFSLMFVVTLMFVGLGIKSALFPFHSALPTAYGSTMTTSNGILSGLVLKGYIVLMVKLIIRVFSGSVIISMYLHDLLFLLGLTGMLFASAAALRQEEVKKMVAYSSSAQISYIFLALGLGTRAGVVAACFQILAHAFTKSMIFLGAGAMIRAADGGHFWGDLRGVARRVPIAGIAFTVGGLSLCGIPLLAGFSAKYSIAVAAFSAQGKTMPALFGLAASSVLNALYYIPAILAIWKRREDAAPVGRLTAGTRELTFAIVCLLLFNVLLGVAVGPVADLIYLGLELL